MGIVSKSPGKLLRKTALSLNEYEKVSYWMEIPLRDFFDWIQDAVELTEERRERQK
jgi:hypothetical protein